MKTKKENILEKCKVRILNQWFFFSRNYEEGDHEINLKAGKPV